MRRYRWFHEALLRVDVMRRLFVGYEEAEGDGDE